MDLSAVFVPRSIVVASILLFGGSAMASPLGSEPFEGGPIASLETPLVLQEITQGQGAPYNDAFAQDRLLLYRLEVGTRSYNSDWVPVDDPLVFGVGLNYEPAYWPIGIEAGFSYSSISDSKDGSGYRSTNAELTFGACKSFWPVEDKLILTLGAGFALTRTKDRLDLFTPPSTTQRSSDSDWWSALYLHSRIAWKYSETFDIGLDLRGMEGQDVKTVGGVRDSQNVQLLLSFGFHV